MRPLADEGETVVIALRVPRELKERFRRACKDRAMSDVLRTLMEEHLKKAAPARKRRRKAPNGPGPRD